MKNIPIHLIKDLEESKEERPCLRLPLHSEEYEHRRSEEEEKSSKEKGSRNGRVIVIDI